MTNPLNLYMVTHTVGGTLPASLLPQLKDEASRSITKIKNVGEERTNG